MKKLKKSLMFGISVVAMLSMASCGITAKDDLIISYDYTNSNGTTETKQINAQSYYERYLEKNKKDHAKAYYDTINEIAVRVSFQKGVGSNGEDGVLSSYLGTVNSEADKAIVVLKNKADEEGKSWHDYLYTLGYDNDSLTDEQNEKLLWNDKQLESMKEKVKNEFQDRYQTWNTSTDATQQKYNTVWGDDGYITQNLPFAIRHILVKCGDSTDNFTSSSITSDQAKKLSRVINKLTNTDNVNSTFGSIAHDETDDTGSAGQNGLYAMGSSLSFVNEFKLGIYAYEAIFNKNLSNSYNEFMTSMQTKYGTYVGFGLPENDKNVIENLGIGYVPFEAVDLLDTYSDLEKKDSKEVNDGKTSYFPRNIIFNKYFNQHNLCFITNQSISKADPTNTNFVNSDTGVGIYSDLDSKGDYKNGGTYSKVSANNHFRKVPGITNDADDVKILCDQNNNPILMSLNATSSGGIHLMSIDRGFFDGYVKDKAPSEFEVSTTDANGNTYTVNQREYYSPVLPISSDGYHTVNNVSVPYYNVGTTAGETDSTLAPSYLDAKTNVVTPKRTFVNNDVKMNVAGYETYKSSTIKTELETNSYASKLTDINTYDWLKTNVNLSIYNKDGKDSVAATAQNLVNMYEVNLRNTLNQTNNKTLSDAWDAYSTTLQKQNLAREYGLIPETCALNFGDTVTKGPNGIGLYAKGGICYYSSSIDQ